jgi:hypothetical protein
MAARRRSIEVSRAVTGVRGRGSRLAAIGRGVTAQDGVEMLGVPAQRYRECFESASAAAALGGVAVQLAHDGHRYLSAFGKLALPPVELGKPCVNRSCDRRPVLRHLFLRAPPSAPKSSPACRFGNSARH